MKTRTLLLLSVACGLLILLAGGVKLLQVATDRTEVPVLQIGDEAIIGDMSVRVVSITNGVDGTNVGIEMSGVPGAAVLTGWRLLGDGEVAEPAGASADGICDRQSVVPSAGTVECVVRFGAVEAVQAVAYTRAGEQRQWAP
ncbi:MAG: hypothetical protein RL391_1894 [Actinomycetota bacterium]